MDFCNDLGLDLPSVPAFEIDDDTSEAVRVWRALKAGKHIVPRPPTTATTTPIAATTTTTTIMTTTTHGHRLNVSRLMLGVVVLLAILCLWAFHNQSTLVSNLILQVLVIITTMMMGQAGMTIAGNVVMNLVLARMVVMVAFFTPLQLWTMNHKVCVNGIELSKKL